MFLVHEQQRNTSRHGTTTSAVFLLTTTVN